MRVANSAHSPSPDSVGSCLPEGGHYGGSEPPPYKLKLISTCGTAVTSQKQLSVVFGAVKPPKAKSRQSRRLAKAKGDDYATVAE